MLTHSPLAPAQVSPLKAPVSSQLKALAADSSVQAPPLLHRTGRGLWSPHATLLALSPSLLICEMGVMSECQGHISCQVSHLNAHPRPRHLKVGLQPPREPCSQEQAVCGAQAGVLAAAPFSAPAAVAPDLCPLPQLGVQLKKGGMFENIFPELLLQFVTARVPDNGCLPYCLEGGAQLPLSKV